MEQERNRRLQECLALVNEAQMKTGCKLTAEPIIVPDGHMWHISAKIVIVDAGGENENL